MFKSLFAIICASAISISLSHAMAGEFVTQEKPSSDRAVPFCSSALGCFLSGVGDLPKTQLIPDRNGSPVSPSSEASATSPISLQGVPITIAAESLQMDRLKDLTAMVSSKNVRVVLREGSTSSRRVDFYVVTSLDKPDADKPAVIFEDQLHILVGPDIRSLTDLTGKVVSFGPNNSEGQAVARQAFDTLHISVEETPLDLDNALDGLSTGDIAAVVILAPPPIAKLRRLTGLGLHLMPWPDSVPVPAGAEVSSIDPKLYPSLAPQGKILPALGVTSVLKKNRDRGGIDEISLAATLRDQRR